MIRGIRVIRVIRKIFICTASAQGTERNAPRGDAGDKGGWGG